MTTDDTARRSAWTNLGAAPHRLFFATGMWQLFVVSIWWLASSVARHHGVFALEPVIPAVFAHGVVMLYALFPPFFAGFLLTVFPRWQPAPPIPRNVQWFAFAALNAGQVLLLAGLYAGRAWMAGGLVALLLGWVALIGALGSSWLQARQRAEQSPTVLAGLVTGFAGLLLVLYALVDATWPCWPLIRGIGLFGFLLPVYFSVCHRMVPFFSSRVVPGYAVYRPVALLHLGVALAIARGLLEPFGAWRWIASAPLAIVIALLVWKWWPRARHGQPLLAVLHYSCAWLVAGVVLQAGDDVLTAAGGAAVLGRAPLHALGIGFFGGMLLSMVTRVTLGHSGRALALDRFTWTLFLFVQVAALLRIAAEFLPPGPWTWLAALAWAAAFVAWSVRYGPIYFRPRADGAPG